MTNILHRLSLRLQRFLMTFTEAPRSKKKTDDERYSKERQRIVRGIRQFFEQNYELRYNVMKQTEEYRPRRNRKAPYENLQAPNFPTEAPCKNLQAPNSSIEAPVWRQLTDREQAKRGWYAKPL